MKKGTKSENAKDIPMVLSRMSWELYHRLYNLRESLLNCDELELAGELEEPIKSFWFYSLFQDAPVLFTVAGPQGVGKSLMVNTLLELPENAWLPVGEESCEHIPVVLHHIDKDDPRVKDPNWKPVIVYQKAEPGDAQFYRLESMSYDEGRERAKKPRENDVIMFWYVEDNQHLQRLSPLAVLPGLELKAPWAKAIKFILDLSDVVIYTLDPTRAAQETAAQMEEWIKEAKLAVRPITVVTKSETLGSQEKQDSLANTLREYGWSPIFIDSLGERGGSGYEELGREITLSLINVPPGIQAEKLRDLLLRKIEPVLKKAESLAREKEASISFEESRAINAVIDRIDEIWKKLVRVSILDTAEKIVSARAEKAHESAREEARKVFKGKLRKIKLWFVGGPSVDDIVKVESAIHQAFSRGLGEELSGVITKEISSRMDMETKEPLSEDVWITNLLVVNLTTPFKDVKKTTDDLVESFAEAQKLSDSMVKFLKSSVDNAGTLTEGAREYAKIIKSRGAGSGEIALAGALGSGGTTLTALEVIGSGVPGAAASAIVGVAGGVVAAVAALSVWSSILRSNR